MAKIALLIGVSKYDLPEFPDLPSAVKDVEAMKEVLGNSKMGGFDEIKVLKNSNRQQIEEAIYELFANRNKDDVLLLYFSGHGVKSREGNLFLATPQTRKEQRGIVTPTAVSASVLQSQMNDSFSKRLVVILDCCYSGAFTKGMTAKGDENIDIQAKLGGEGRAILMSSSSTQSSFESEVSELSIYTKYIVEGIKTGAADTDNNGKISADELHQYVRKKVKEESLAMTPQFAPVKEGYRIYLVHYPQKDMKLQYRRQVKEILRENNGEISCINHNVLQNLSRKMGLPEREVEEILTEEMQPYILKNKLKDYEYVLNLAVKEGYPLSKNIQEIIQKFQSLLGLKDEDVAPIEEQFLPLELLSDKNVDYRKLDGFLANCEWQEADIETSRCMLKAARQKKQGYLDVEDIENFPSTDLRTIDQLWVKHSNGKFGFSVQKKIYQSLGGTKDYNRKIWEKFGNKIGWREGNEWLGYYERFMNTNYMGHLPCGWVVCIFVCFGWGTLLSRRDL